MNRPRIAMVLNTMGLGGVPQVACELIRHLPRDAFDIRLGVLKGASDRSTARDLRETRFTTLGVPVTYATAGSGKFDAVPELARWLSAERIDILHSHSYRPNVYARLAGALARGSGVVPRIVAHYHNQYDDKWERDPVMLGFEQQLARLTDAMLAVSGSVRDHVAARLALAPERIEVVRNGVTGAAFAGGDRVAGRAMLGIVGAGPVLGLIGRVCEQKGQDTFVRAALEVAPMDPEATFVMIGDIESKRLHQRLVADIEAAGLADRVRFTGHQSDMAAAYAALDVVVAPSRWEGFGLMLVEAMAAGRPIVATAVGAIPEVVGGDGAAMLVHPDDPTELAAAMAELMRDPGRRDAMSLAGRRRQADFSWKAAAATVASIYERLLAGRYPTEPGRGG